MPTASGERSGPQPDDHRPAGRPAAEELRALAETVVDAIGAVPDEPSRATGARRPGVVALVAALLDPRFRAFVRAGNVARREYARVLGVDRGAAMTAVEDLRMQLLWLVDPADEPRVGVGALVAAAEALLEVDRTGDTDDPALARAVRAWDRVTDAVARYRRDGSDDHAGRLAAATAAHRQAWAAWFAAHGIDPAR